MSKIINLQEYLENKSIEELNENLDKLDFGDPDVVKALFKSLITSYSHFTKTTAYALEILVTTSTNLTEHITELKKNK